MLNQALNQRDALAAELAAKCSALEKERLENKFLKCLEKELEQAQTEIQELKDEMSLWETTTPGEENDRLKEELEQAHHEWDKERKIVDELNAYNAKLEKKLEALEEELKQEKASVKCLRAENAELEKQVEECSELEDEKERLEEEVHDLETEKEELEEEVEKLEGEMEKLRETVKDYERSQLEEKVTLAQVAAHVKAQEEKAIVKCLRAENAELEKRTELLEGEVEELQRRLRTFEPAADWGEQLKASRETTDEALRVAEKNQTLYHKEVERSHAHEKRIEELEQRCYDIGNKLMEMEIERKEMLEALADKDKRIVKAVSRVVELEKGAGKAEEVERLTNLVKALCAENMRLHDQFGS